MQACINCGEILDDSEKECSNCGAYRCPECGHIVPEDSTYCKQCGDKIE